MPIRRIPPQPRHNHPGLVKLLANELRNPTDEQAPGAKDCPIVIEEESGYGQRLHVRVIWAKWDQVTDKAERAAIILDAYDEAGCKDKAALITLALGLTMSEADRIGISY